MPSTAGNEYPPSQSVGVQALPADFASLFPPPPGLLEDTWPPTQLTYLGVYLSSLGCKTVVSESHYIDRDYIHDMALFYSRSLRCYPNFCQRLHFFTEDFDLEAWKRMVGDTDNYVEKTQVLQKAYLGYCVVRPLPGSPIGRTVLVTFGPTTPTDTRSFDAVRDYDVHLGGFKLTIRGLAFQQQDQGVSACATTALWSSLNKVAQLEDLAIPTPAEITQAASRYLLAEGRALPSEGLNINQICEAIRGSGLQPLVSRSVSFAQDCAQLHGYIRSGLAPVLAIQPVQGGSAHAVCAVGLKIGEVAPQTTPTLNYRDAATSVRAVYIHDDRLGPYASAALSPWTIPATATSPTKIATGLLIQWPDKVDAEQSILLAIIVPMPHKLRMSISRVRWFGLALAQAVGTMFTEFAKQVVFGCRYQVATAYRSEAHQLGLSESGLYLLSCETVLSRYIGLIEFSIKEEPLFDVLLDATETRANPSILAFVRRKGFPDKHKTSFELIARNCGGRVIW